MMNSNGLKDIFWEEAGSPDKEKLWEGAELQNLVRRLSARVGKELHFGNARTLPSGELLAKLVRHSF